MAIKRIDLIQDTLDLLILQALGRGANHGYGIAVTALIMRQSGMVVLGGIATGLVVTLIGAQVIQSLLYDVAPRDPAVLITSTAGLVGVALCACWLPARRAARVKPASALRVS